MYTKRKDWKYAYNYMGIKIFYYQKYYDFCLKNIIGLGLLGESISFKGVKLPKLYYTWKEILNL